METSLPTSIFWCYVSFREGIIQHQLGNEKNPKLFRVYRGLYGWYYTVNWGLRNHSIKIPVKQPMESKGPRVVFLVAHLTSNQPTVHWIFQRKARSSHHEGRLRGSQLHAAPQEVTSKMRHLGSGMVGWLGGWVVSWLVVYAQNWGDSY